MLRFLTKPRPQRTRLPLTQGRERNIHIPTADVDEVQAISLGDVAGTLAVPNQPE